MCYWKQWRYVRTKVRNLLALGTRKRQAIITGLSSKSLLASVADAGHPDRNDE